MAAVSLLLEAFSEEQLSELTDARSLLYGSDYAVDGSVRNLKVSEKRIGATVVGQRAYEVRLGLRHGEATWSCTCPVGRRGVFCKHGVAAALAAHQNVEDGSEVVGRLEHSLAQLDHEQIVHALLAAAKTDAEFARQLQVAIVGKMANTEAKADEFKDVIDGVFADRGFVDYYEIPRFVQQVEEVIDSIEQLILPNDPRAAMLLGEYVDSKLNELIDFVEDSAEDLWSLSERLSELHLDAATRANVDPIELADRLFALEIEGGRLGTFGGAQAIYEELLGHEGNARFEELVREAWKGTSQGAKDPSDSHARRIKSMLLAVAQKNNDVDLTVQLLSQDLSHESNFLRVVQTLRDAERYDEAFEWVCRGLKAFPPMHDLRLFDLFIEECFRQGRGNEAVDAMWAQFDDFPTERKYGRLREVAEMAGVWEAVRPMAIERLRIDIGDKSPKATASKLSIRYPMLASSRTDASTLVSVLLSEGAVEDAWKAAQDGGCFDSLWMTLAECREQSHPIDVIPIYKREAESCINHMGNDNYARATELLVHIQSLMNKAGIESDFSTYIATLVKTHKAKRNLMQFFEHHAWTP